MSLIYIIFVQKYINTYICTITFCQTLVKPKNIRKYYERRTRFERYSDFEPIIE